MLTSPSLSSIQYLFGSSTVFHHARMPGSFHVKRRKLSNLAPVAVSRERNEKEGTRSNAWLKVFPHFAISYRMSLSTDQKAYIAHGAFQAVTPSLDRVLADTLVCFRVGTLMKGS